MAEITKQRQMQESLHIQQEPIQQQKKASQAGVPMPDMQQMEQIPAEILAKIQALPIQIPKNMYEGVAVENYDELITDQYRTLSNGTMLVDRKLQFREFQEEKKASA